MGWKDLRNLAMKRRAKERSSDMFQNLAEFERGQAENIISRRS